MAEGEVLAVGTADEIKVNKEVIEAYLGSGSKTAVTTAPVAEVRK